MATLGSRPRQFCILPSFAMAETGRPMGQALAQKAAADAIFGFSGKFQEGYPKGSFSFVPITMKRRG
jgi:hypothetical protein